MRKKQLFTAIIGFCMVFGTVFATTAQATNRNMDNNTAVFTEFIAACQRQYTGTVDSQYELSDLELQQYMENCFVMAEYCRQIQSGEARLSGYGGGCCR